MLYTRDSPINGRYLNGSINAYFFPPEYVRAVSWKRVYVHVYSIVAVIWSDVGGRSMTKNDETLSFGPRDEGSVRF